MLYALEGFLARLSLSTRRDDLILKGGVLLAAFGARRPTRDVDLQVTHIPSDVDSVRAIVTDVLEKPHDDGLEFQTANVSASVIREEGDYSGVRVAVDARLARARMRLKIDVNVGDPIWPEPDEIEIPRLIDDDSSISLRGYPLHMVHAERDFADVYLLSRAHDIDGRLLQQAVTSWRSTETYNSHGCPTCYAATVSSSSRAGFGGGPRTTSSHSSPTTSQVCSKQSAR